MDLATPDAFHNDPSLVWQFYSYRRHIALKAKPNKGHLALAELSRRRPTSFLTLTQNVDGLSSRADHPQDSLLSLHGDLFSVKCTSFMCNYNQHNLFDDPLTPALKVDDEEYEDLPSEKPSKEEASTKAAKPKPPPQMIPGLAARYTDLIDKDYYSSSGITDLDDSAYSSTSSAYISNGYNVSTRKKKPETTSETHRDTKNNGSSSSSTKQRKKKKFIKKDIPLDLLPRCPSCKVGLLRPGVVWFGEALPFQVLQKADDFITDPNEPPVDLILVIGTSGSVWPAAGYVEQVALRGGKVAVFNIDTDSDEAQFKEQMKDGGWFFQGDAAELLPKALEPIIGKLRPKRKY